MSIPRPQGRGRRASGPAFVAGAAMMLAVSACGVPVERTASATPATDLPYGLHESPAAELAPDAAQTSATVYLVGDGRLVAVQRTVTDPGVLGALVAQLSAPLLAPETSRGLRTALNDVDLVGAVTRTSNLATVELTDSFSRLSSKEQELALGQVVFTLTERDEVDRIRFSRDGEPLAIPTDTGALVDAPVTRYDYRQLR